MPESSFIINIMRSEKYEKYSAIIICLLNKFKTDDNFLSEMLKIAISSDNYQVTKLILEQHHFLDQDLNKICNQALSDIIDRTPMSTIFNENIIQLLIYHGFNFHFYRDQLFCKILSKCNISGLKYLINHGAMFDNLINII